MAYTAATTPPMPTAPSEQPTFRENSMVTGDDPIPAKFFILADVSYPVIYSAYDTGEAKFNQTPFIGVAISLKPGEAEQLKSALAYNVNVALVERNGLTITGTSLTLDFEAGLTPGSKTAALRLVGKPQSIHWG